MAREARAARPTVAILAGASLAALAMMLLGAASCQEPRVEEPPPARFLKQQGLEGKVALVEFGTIGCALSESGLDKMIRMHKAREIDGLVYVRVEREKEDEASRRYYTGKAPGFGVCYDAGAALAKAFDAIAIPTVLLVDKFGRVRYRGPFPEAAKLAEWVAALREQKADAGPEVALFGLSPLEAPKLLAETKLPDLGGTVKPLREWAGPKGLLAVFVDTRCPFSGQAVTDMPKVAGDLAKRQVSSVLVNLGEKEKTVREFYAKRELGMPVVYDTTTATQKAWHVDAVPTVVLFDAGGTVVYRGRAVWADLAAATESALKLQAGSIQFGTQGTAFG